MMSSEFESGPVPEPVDNPVGFGAEPPPVVSKPPLVRVQNSRPCPMCGAAVDLQSEQCLACGEPLIIRNVPIYSRWHIGAVSFLFGVLSGLFLLWRNCRCLNRRSAATAVLATTGVMLAVLLPLSSAIPFIELVVAINLMACVVVLILAELILGEEFKRYRQRKGPYVRAWKVLVLGFVVCIVSLLLNTLWLIVASQLGWITTDFVM